MRKSLSPVLCCVCLVAACFTARASLSVTNLYNGPAWSLLDVKKVMAAAGEITKPKYPDCDEATVEKNLVRIYNADGTGACQDEAFVKILTEKGKRGNRTLSLSFMLPYSTEEVVRLEVIKPDGTVIPVDVAANSKETIDDSQMEMNIYDPNSRVLQVSIPQVEIGDVVHSVSRQTITRSFMPGQYAELNVFEEPGYIRHISYTVQAPADRPLERIALRDEVPGTVHYSTNAGPDHSVIHRWEVQNVPRMFGEPSMPPGDMVLQRVLVSTTPDWQAVSKWYWDLSRPHLDATEPEMTNKVNELTAGARTDLEKVKSIFYYVSKNIRYMGLTDEKDRPGYEPHDVKITYDKKYGVCRDKAALLVSLLRAAGLNSYPVLINVGTKMDPGVPDPFFNHAIVSVELTKGKYVLMDPTDEHTRNLLPSYDCDQSYLVCRPEGEDLRVSSIEPPEEHMMEIKTTGTLKANGSLEATSRLFFEGVNDDAYRNAFSHMKPDDRRRFFERNLKRALPGARLTSLKLYPEDMLDVGTPVHAEVAFTVDGMTATGNGKSMISVPWIGKDFGVVNFILGGCGLDKRKYPMRTEVACGMKETISLKMSDGFESTVSMPTCPPVDDNCIDYNEHVAFQGSMLDCARDLKLKVVEFTPRQYLTLKKTLKSMEYDERKVPVLAVSESAANDAEKAADPAAPPVDSDATILDSQKVFTLTGAHSGVYRAKYSKKILNYAGKIREAEVKIDFNPSCQVAKLVRAVVTSETGQRQEIGTNEVNVMDAGWNASAKRYTGGKILVANLPSVDMGSTIEVEYEITTTNKPFIGGFEPFQFRDVTLHKSFELTAPANAVSLETLVTGKTNSIRQEVNTGSGPERYVWQATNVAAEPAEGQLPPDWAYSTGVAYFAGNIDEYLQALNDRMTACAQKGDKAAKTAKDLTAALEKPLDKIRAVRDFVAKSIREAGPSFTDLPLSELSAADTTLNDGYGHAADRAILLYSMLSAAGFQPEFVLASDLPPIAGITNVSLKFPMPSVFRSPLVRVTVDGEQYYLNDTDQYAKLGATGYDGRQAVALATRAREIIKAVPGCEDKMETDYTLAVSDNGGTRVSVTHRYFGDYYGGKNRFFSELPPEERRRYFQNVVSDVAQGARPVDELVTKFDQYPGVEAFTVDVDNYGVVDGKYLYFDLPFTPMLFPAGADRRTLPLFLNRRDRNVVRTEIDLPKNFQNEVIAPKSRDLEVPDGGGDARITATATPGKYVITDVFDTSPAIVDPRNYGAMLKLESALERKSSKVFLFSSAAP